MTGRLIARELLPGSIEDEMWRLLRRHFVGVTRPQFRADLMEKDWVVLVEGERGEILGFTTFQVTEHEIAGELLQVVYSGDTIVDRAGRAAAVLPAAWIGAVNRLRREHGWNDLWWLLIVSGFRTYRFLPVFWREFVPGPGENCSGLLARRDRLARERFGPRFDPASGIVRFAEPQLLGGRDAGIPPRRLNDRHVEFFAKVNPGHENGDELVCLAELSPDNLTRAGRRMWAVGDSMLADGVLLS